MHKRSLAPKNSYEYKPSQSVIWTKQLSCSLFQYKRVYFYHSKSLGSLHLSSRAISFWWTWIVTKVSIFVLSTEVFHSSRHIAERVDIISVISLFFYSIAFFSPRETLSSPSVTLAVHRIYKPMSEIWEASYLMKALRTMFMTLFEALFAISRRVICIFYSSTFSHDSMLPSHLTT